jgi:WD40 repeat protein
MVASLTFSPDGRFVLTASGDRTLRLQDVASGQAVLMLDGQTNWVRARAFSPDGRLALSASYDQRLRLWNVASGRTVYGHQQHTDLLFLLPLGQMAQNNRRATSSR